jgi:hypothetical protein
LLPALLILAAVFALLFVTRVGGAQRYELLKRWPAVVLAGAALFALARGMIWPTIALSALAVLAWMLWPRLAAQPSSGADRPTAESREDAEARSVLGVGAAATAEEIRAAYRAKMAHAHPDRGGKHAEAARLTAARDRLLRMKR